MMLYEQVEYVDMRKNIGIDVGKDGLDLCWLKDNETGKIKSKKFPNKITKFTEVASWIIKNCNTKSTNILVTLEATGVYHEAIVYFLHLHGFQVFLSNPGKAKKFSEALGHVHKTDKSDAKMLARYGSAQLGQLRLWKPEEQSIRELKAMSRRLSALEKDFRRENNRLEASETSGVSQRVIKSLSDVIVVLGIEIKSLKHDIDHHINSNPTLKKNKELLKTINGIGDVMARELVYLFAAKDFNTAKQVAAYVGLIPKLNESGTFKGRTTLSKSGPSRIRAKLFLAAVTATKHNPDVRAQNDRLIRAGKTKIQALGAAMRKLIQICFGVVKNRTEYRPQVIKI